MNNYTGIIIEESLRQSDVLNKLKIISTEIEEVTRSHNTPWVSVWTIHTIEILEKDAEIVANEISKSIDEKHSSSWYVEFKNNRNQYVIFYDKIFCINKNNEKEKLEAINYGLSIGIPEQQLDF